MQEDKPSLFNTADILESSIDIFNKMMPKITINEAVMRQAASCGFLNATDMADYLVGQGVPFRKAHEVVGKAVAFALGESKELHELTLKELQSFSPVIEQGLFGHLTLEHMISRRLSAGGTSQENVKAAIELALKETDAITGTAANEDK